MKAHPHIASHEPAPPRWLLPVAARGPPAAERTTAPLPLDPFFRPSEFSMTTAVLRPPVFNRKPLTAIALLALLTLGLGVAMPGYALDLVAFTGITGPMVSALTQIAARWARASRPWSASLASSSR